MRELSSPRWCELRDAYGSAGKIPDLLRQLSDCLPTTVVPNHGSVYGVPLLTKAMCTRLRLQRFHMLSRQLLAHQLA